MMVLDASAVAQLLLRRAGGDAVARRIGADNISLHAPHLLTLEVVQTLRQHEGAGVITEHHAAVAVDALLDLGIELHEPAAFVHRIWPLRHNLTAYDASYVALAEALDAPLLTFDARLARSPGHTAHIELLTAA